MTLSIPFILFISGASGSGKTTLLKEMAHRFPLHATACFHFDSIGVPSVEEMIKVYGSPSEWQKVMTEKWVERLLTEFSDKQHIFFEGQVNLEFIETAFMKHSFKNYKIILIHCDDVIRHERLRDNREQPELINQDMDNWAHFLKRQALERGVPILDSGALSVAEMADWVGKY